MTRIESTQPPRTDWIATIASAGRARSGSAPGYRARSRMGLASARDRQRVRERDAAERERVEKMLASAPPPEERLHFQRQPEPQWQPQRRLRDDDTPALHAPPRLRALPSSTCPVCDSAKVVRDEVMHGGTLQISECLHCDHRWTERPRARWAEIGANMSRGRRAPILNAAAPA